MLSLFPNVLHLVNKFGEQFNNVNNVNYVNNANNVN